MRHAKPAAAAARRCGSRDPRGGGVAWMLHNSGACRCRDRRPSNPRCRPTGGGPLLAGAVALGGVLRASPPHSPSTPPRPPPLLLLALRPHGAMVSSPSCRLPPPRPPPPPGCLGRNRRQSARGTSAPERNCRQAAGGHISSPMPMTAASPPR